MRDGALDDLYDVPHSTLSTATINGASAINVVPRECEFIFEFRFLAEVDLEAIMAEIRGYTGELLRAMRAVAPEAEIVFQASYDYP